MRTSWEALLVGAALCVAASIVDAGAAALGFFASCQCLELSGMRGGLSGGQSPRASFGVVGAMHSKARLQTPAPLSGVRSAFDASIRIPIIF